MRKISLIVALVGALAACATGQKKAPVPSASLPMCLPCNNPCVAPDSCQPVVAKAAPTPTPTPEPTPPPPPPPPAPAMAASFDPPGGKYDAPQKVKLSSSTPGAVIHYTTDGSTPTESSPVYSGPIDVRSSTAIKTLVTAPGAAPSEVSSADYSVEEPKRVVVTKQKLELKDKVYFDTGKATIKPESNSLLDEVASALKFHDEVKKIRVEGHTDNVGGAKLNKKLSQARAESVQKYLVDKGIDPARLTAQGFGQSKPIATNKNAKGREKNRRVEFVVLP